MCGFTGFVGAIENKEQVLENMMNTIVHRGPDSAGTFLDDDAALGFRRLSIIDISSTGDQPLYNEDRTKVLVFNGEIYNYQELREKLIEAGHEFKKIHAVPIFNLRTIRACTIKHDKPKAHEKNDNCQQTVIEILNNTFFYLLFFFSFFPLFFTSSHIYTPHRILTARYS